MGGHTDMGMGDNSSATAGGGGSMGGMEMESMLNCAGQPIPERQGNTQGHVLPGIIFMLWATHWLVSASWRHITAQRAGRAFQARSSEGLLPMVPALSGFNKYPVESALKAIGGILLFILQITYGSYKNLVCDVDDNGMLEPRAGRLATNHLNSWAHASMNLGYSLSGMVELLGAHSKLPQGTNLAVLGGAFFIEGLLFDMHEKNGHLDQTVHWLLAMTCMAGAVFALLEAAFPESFLLTAGRIGSMLLQGTWFCQTAAVLFGGSLVWNDTYNGHEDQAPAMFLPMIFTYHMLLITSFMIAVYAGLEAYSRRLHPGGAETSGSPSFGGFETSRLLSEDSAPEHGVMMTPITGIRNGLRK